VEFFESVVARVREIQTVSSLLGVKKPEFGIMPSPPWEGCPEGGVGQTLLRVKKSLGVLSPGRLGVDTDRDG
jgi:hypothetical protein